MGVRRSLAVVGVMVAFATASTVWLATGEPSQGLSEGDVVPALFVTVIHVNHQSAGWFVDHWETSGC
jgi:hypothetical protein